MDQFRIEAREDINAQRTLSAERVTIPVTGMTCAACQSFLQRTLSAQTGVEDASVNLMLNNATVVLDRKSVV